MHEFHKNTFTIGLQLLALNFTKYKLRPKVQPELPQTFKTSSFAAISNVFQLLTIIAKLSNVDVGLGRGYVSATFALFKNVSGNFTAALFVVFWGLACAFGSLKQNQSSTWCNFNFDHTVKQKKQKLFFILSFPIFSWNTDIKGILMQI